MAMPPRPLRIPMAVKIGYTAFMAVLVPVYWYYYGPTNFLYFCDAALIITLIGIWMDRSLEMVIAILAVLKAGGGYLPLDPVYPKERLAFILDDANVDLLLTQTALAGELPQYRGSSICVDLTAQKATEREIPLVGLTTRPKIGVLIDWSNVPGLIPRVRRGPDRGKEWSEIAEDSLEGFLTDRKSGWSAILRFHQMH